MIDNSFPGSEMIFLNLRHSSWDSINRTYQSFSGLHSLKLKCERSKCPKVLEYLYSKIEVKVIDAIIYCMFMQLIYFLWILFFNLHCDFKKCNIIFKYFFHNEHFEVKCEHNKSFQASLETFKKTSSRIIMVMLVSALTTNCSH